MKMNKLVEVKRGGGGGYIFQSIKYPYSCLLLLNIAILCYLPPLLPPLFTYYLLLLLLLLLLFYKSF
jgi:hypothetical protein